ncbi:Cof-type HAD-IIB family hydrolase [Capnocytophaga canimorsus]|uniref:Cof-type HAD-IIB family hydrolase n=1 Tax=Capnocytophaga canimorsus TaxID=28188 RepID=UPI00385C33F3
MKLPKIIFSDIDGTLLNSDRDLSEKTIEQVKRVGQKIPFLLVSARMPKQMTHLQKKLSIENSPKICYNGALVLSGNNEVIRSVEIPNHFIRKLVEFNQSLSQKIHISLFHNDQWFVENYDQWAAREENNTQTQPQIRSNEQTLAQWESENIGAHKIMCMGEANLIDVVFNYMQEHFGKDLHLYRSKDTYIEISNMAVSKLTGIQQLMACEFPKLRLEDVMTFGDNYNDVEMTKAVGFGVAVANARPEVIAVANAITDHHKENGVANFLEKMTI